MKRILSFLLAAVLLLSLLPAMTGRAEAATGDKLVALTFDDGPSGWYTEQLLNGLAERGVPATFFMLGYMAEDNPDVVRRAYEEGHEIACHSWDHPDLTGLNDSKVREQMEKTYAVLDEACGQGTKYLVRPPYGSTNGRVRSAIDAPLIYWSVDSRDWELRNSAKVRDRICADAYDGCIILCHDIHKTTIPAALEVIDILQARGYEFVTVSELYRRRGRALEDHVLHYNSNRNGVDYGPIQAPKIAIRYNGNGTFTVTMANADGNVPIYYTLDGSYPNQEAIAYTGPFTVDYFTEITAVAAYNLNGSRSGLTVLTAEDYPCLAPTMGLDSAGRLVLHTGTPGAEIHYTLDNTDPAGGRRYSGPVEIPGGSYVRSVAEHPDAGVSAATGTWYYSDHGQLYADMYPEQWFYDAMERVHLMGILNGTAAYTMSPDATLTRAMLVTLLHRASGESLGSHWDRTNAFADVGQDAYYAEAVEWAWRHGIVNGYSDTAFGPNDPVTREQMCKIVAGYLRHMDMPLLPGRDCLDVFDDRDAVSQWALESVAALVKVGMIRGTGTSIDPDAKASRAQFCTLLCRVLDYAEGYVPLELTLGQEKLTITEGEQTALGYAYNGDEGDLIWSSENPEIATVDAKGVVTAWMPGDTRITVTDGLNTAICEIQVEPAIPAVERIEIVGTDAPFETGMIGYQGDYVNLTVRTLPPEAEDAVNVTSDDPAVVAVVLDGGPDENGCSRFRLDFVGPGSTNVTIESADGGVQMVFAVEVRQTYAFDPGEGSLTPGEFAEYATRVLTEAGFQAAQGGSWRLMWLAPEELTFDGAVAAARECIHTWWPEGIHSGAVVYVGEHEDGRYEFRLCWD